MKMTFTRTFARSVVVAAIVVTAPSLSALEIEEVVVTAQKREQSSQDVGIAINAFTGSTLDAMGLNSSNEIAMKTPNLNIHSPAGEGGVAVVFMRGVGLNDFATNNTGPVGFYIDEVYAGSSNGQVTTLFDVERVEVLKGPQGTLYGRNTTGGALNIISRKPTEEIDGYVKVSYGDYSEGNGEYRLEGAIGGALSDNLQGRLAFVNFESEGYMTNALTGDDVEKENRAARVLLNWDVGEEINILLNLHTSKNDSDADLYNSSLDADFYAGVSDIKPVIDVEQHGLSVKVNWELNDELTLTSITAYDELDKLHQEDADMLPLPIIHTEYGVTSETFSQEIRLTGDTDTMSWIAGAFFWDDQLDQAQSVDLTGVGLPIPYVYDNSQDTQTFALFGQTEYNLTDALVLTVGLRYTSLEVNFESVGSGTAILDPATPGGIAASYRFADSLDEDNVSGKLGLNWFISDAVMMYGSVTKGFKGAGFNGNFHLSTLGLGDYDSEDLLAYETGIKSTFFNQTLQLNAAVFYYDYQDSQVFNNATIPGFGLPANRIANADIDIQGIDVDIIWRPIDGLYMQLGAGYVDSEYGEDINDPITGSLLISGNQLQNTPEISAFGLINYEWNLGDAGYLIVQFDASYSDDLFYSNFEDISIGQEAYTISNARISYRSTDEAFELALWAKNLSDKEYATYSFDLRADFGFVQNMRGVPRTVGIDVKYSF